MQSNLATALSCLKSDIISVFITNLGKYNEGELCGEWLTLPTTPEAVNAVFKRIGLDGTCYEEYFLTDYESTIEGIIPYIGEYSNLNELNYLASRLESLSRDDITLYEAIVEMGEGVTSITDLINLCDNLECYHCLTNVHDEHAVGYYWVEESGCYDLTSLGYLANYIDYAQYGHDVVLEQGGFFSSQGYVYPTGDALNAYYDGLVIPDEYRVIV